MGENRYTHFDDVVVNNIRSDHHSIIKGRWYVSADTNITDHGAISGADYESFNLKRLIDLIGSAKAEIVVSPGTYNFNTNTTVPSNIKISFSEGAFFTGSAEIIFYGDYNAGYSYVFSDSLTYEFKNKSSVLQAENFGIIGDYEKSTSTGKDNTDLFYFVASIAASNNKDIAFGDGSFFIAPQAVKGDFDLSKRYVTQQIRLIGQGRSRTTLVGSTDYDNYLFNVKGPSEINIIGITFDTYQKIGEFWPNEENDKFYLKDIGIKNFSRDFFSSRETGSTSEDENVLFNTIMLLDSHIYNSPGLNLRCENTFAFINGNHFEHLRYDTSLWPEANKERMIVGVSLIWGPGSTDLPSTDHPWQQNNKNIIVTNNVFEDIMAYGDSSHLSGVSVSGTKVVVKGNVFRNISRADGYTDVDTNAVYVKSYDVLISGNIIENCSSVGESEGSITLKGQGPELSDQQAYGPWSNNLNVMNNIIKTTVGSRTAIASTSSMADINISNNMMSGFHRTISLQGGKRIALKGNIYQGCTGQLALIWPEQIEDIAIKNELAFDYRPDTSLDIGSGTGAAYIIRAADYIKNVTFSDIDINMDLSAYTEDIISVFRLYTGATNNAYDYQFDNITAKNCHTTVTGNNASRSVGQQMVLNIDQSSGTKKSKSLCRNCSVDDDVNSDWLPFKPSSDLGRNIVEGFVCNNKYNSLFLQMDEPVEQDGKLFIPLKLADLDLGDNIIYDEDVFDWNGSFRRAEVVVKNPTSSTSAATIEIGQPERSIAITGVLDTSSSGWQDCPVESSKTTGPYPIVATVSEEVFTEGILMLILEWYPVFSPSWE